MQSSMTGRYWNLLITAVKFSLGLIFFLGGLSKLMTVPNFMGPVWLEEELAKHELGLFARFIAVVQIATGTLLLTRRFALIGAIMLSPMLLNMLVITLSLHWKGTPYVIAFFLVLNLLLLFDEFPRLKALISEDRNTLDSVSIRRTNTKADVLVLGGCTLLVLGSLLFRNSAVSGWILVTSGALFSSIGALYKLR